MLDGAVDAIEEPEFARELEGEVAQREHVPMPADPFYDVAVVVRRQGALDAPLQPEPSPEVGLLHGVNLIGPRGRRARRPSPAGPRHRRGMCRAPPPPAAPPGRRPTPPPTPRPRPPPGRS